VSDAGNDGMESKDTSGSRRGGGVRLARTHLDGLEAVGGEVLGLQPDEQATPEADRNSQEQVPAAPQERGAVGQQSNCRELAECGQRCQESQGPRSRGRRARACFHWHATCYAVPTGCSAAAPVLHGLCVVGLARGGAWHLQRKLRGQGAHGNHRSHLQVGG